MTSAKVANNNNNNNKTANRISLPLDNRSLHSHSNSHDILLKHQQYPQLITPPEESLQQPLTEAVAVKQLNENGKIVKLEKLLFLVSLLTVDCFFFFFFSFCINKKKSGTTSTPLSPTATTTAGIIQRPTTPPLLPPRPRSRTIHVVPGFKEDFPLPPLPPSKSLSKGSGGRYLIDSEEVAASVLATSLTSPTTTSLSSSQQRRILLPNNMNNNNITCQFPNMQHFDRLPPHIKTITSHHRRTLRAIAGCQGRLATASHTIKAWEHAVERPNVTISITPSTDSSGVDRICSLAYTFSGHYLWAGLDDGHVVVMDTKKQQHQQQQHKNYNSNNKLLAELHHHEYAVKHILRVDSNELWTIDDGGLLLRWPMVHDYDNLDHKSINHEGYQHRVTPKAISAVVLQAQHHHVLAMTAGDTIDIYRFVPFYSSSMQQAKVELPYRVIRIPNELGQITQLLTLPQGRFACAHVNGRISVWSIDRWELILQVTIPIYGVSAMALSLNRYLWTGYRTGMIYVYDISSDEQWKLVKMWQAHQGPITMFTVDELGLITSSPNEKPLVQVISADQQGNVIIWDGLLSEYQKGIIYIVFFVTITAIMY